MAGMDRVLWSMKMEKGLWFHEPPPWSTLPAHISCFLSYTEYSSLHLVEMSGCVLKGLLSREVPRVESVCVS